MKRKVFIFITMLLCGTAFWFAYSPANSETTAPKPAPTGMTISLKNTSVLDYSDCFVYPHHGIKVTFYGSRYSDGQEVWDPSSPFICNDIYYNDPFCLCSNFYYQDGFVDVYARPNESSSWVFQGSMLMSSNNCTKDGSKVTLFTVNCTYLSHPD